MSAAVVIPARLASTRLPRKVLRDIHGKPLIQWVYERSAESLFVKDVFVITPDDEIKEVVERFGGRVIPTGPAPTVLDRCSMVADELDKMNYKHTIVVQGDEPTIFPEMIDMLIQKEVPYGACLVKKIDAMDDVYNPNMVKVIFDTNNYFMYLSRSVIPGGSPEKDYLGYSPTYYKQVCVMSFNTKFLQKYKNMLMGPLERSEGIDLIRFIEHQYRLIEAVETGYQTQAVDTAEDLEKVAEMLR